MSVFAYQTFRAKCQFRTSGESGVFFLTSDRSTEDKIRL